MTSNSSTAKRSHWNLEKVFVEGGELEKPEKNHARMRINKLKLNLFLVPTSFPGSLIFPPPGTREERGKTRDPGNEAVLVPDLGHIDSSSALPPLCVPCTCCNYFLDPKGVCLWKA